MSISADAVPRATLPTAGWSPKLALLEVQLGVAVGELDALEVGVDLVHLAVDDGCVNGPLMAMRARGLPDSHVESGAGRSASGPRP